MDTEKMFEDELERKIKERLENSGRFESGQVEALQARVAKLEDAVSHLAAFIAGHLRLSIVETNVLTDF
jgi:polyhydroxyalkanoate synthesis regulator phasin